MGVDRELSLMAGPWLQILEVAQQVYPLEDLSTDPPNLYTCQRQMSQHPQIDSKHCIWDNNKKRGEKSVDI